MNTLGSNKGKHVSLRNELDLTLNMIKRRVLKDLQVESHTIQHVAVFEGSSEICSDDSVNFKIKEISKRISLLESHILEDSSDIVEKKMNMCGANIEEGRVRFSNSDFLESNQLNYSYYVYLQFCFEKVLNSLSEDALEYSDILELFHLVKRRSDLLEVATVKNDKNAFLESKKDKMEELGGDYLDDLLIFPDISESISNYQADKLISHTKLGSSLD